ncbi:hypothetical protein MMC25_007088 [Agyrium rufum]|nr:hypothetical protein [Agyrium rufum]
MAYPFLVASNDSSSDNSSGNPLFDNQTHDPRDLKTQALVSIVFGLSAFLAFCTLRPRWTALYAARKRQKSSATKLPDLPDSFLGWIPALYRVSEEQVLASAGLDAFVFLAFFRMAIRFLLVVFFFSLVVLLPIHKHFDEKQGSKGRKEKDADAFPNLFSPSTYTSQASFDVLEGGDSPTLQPTTGFLWVYVVFVYLFSGYLCYLIVTETKRIIKIRQQYLGTQSSVTDRTIRLSGIPIHLRSEETLKDTIEKLEIGKVESVMLCRDWGELDGLMAERMTVLRKLEESWTVHLGLRRKENRLESLSRVPQSDPSADNESVALLDGNGDAGHGSSDTKQDRPTTRIWYGRFNLQYRKIDAIDYYEEQLRRLDEKIKAAREKEYKPTPLAFVTMDSIAACQMAVQAIIDPTPTRLVANLAPAPADVVWRNTYLSRPNRMARAWTITLIIALLTVFWSVLLIPLAGLLNLRSIRKVSPAFADALEANEILSSLIQTSLTTLLISLLNVAVPYLYDWLSNLQGMISQGDIEMSIISKNFFFTFVNLFVVFTVFGTASNAYELSEQIGDALKDTSRVANVLARSLEGLGPFYMNLIVLQGLGLFPFRLLEFGAVSLYPIYRMGAKTPRDYAELVQPPVFSYGFFLPQTILIFIICLVYSILPDGELVTFFGLLYFIIGSFIYKYQLLYAMDHRQHSTGRAWIIICNRILVGLVVFQLAMLGTIAGRSAVKSSLLIVPLLVGTVWFGYFYRRSYQPLMKYIALRSLHDDEAEVLSLGESRYATDTAGGRMVDESEETGIRFINPSLIIPLEDVWIAKRNMDARERRNGNEEA